MLTPYNSDVDPARDNGLARRSRWTAQQSKRISFSWITAIVLFSIFAFQSDNVFAQGSLINGENHNGAISVPHETDSWIFGATAGNSIYLSIGEIVDNNTFVPSIRIFGPNGTQLDSRAGSVSAHLGIVAPLTGTYTVLVSSGDQLGNGTGTYRITLANIPDAFVVPASDDGGPMTNGANHVGTFHLADLDQWTFHATAGSSIYLSIGEIVDNNTFSPWIRLFSPDGTQLDSRGGSVSAHLGVVAPLTGTYTVLVDTGEQNGNGTGTYRITLANIPDAFVVPAGDDGGPMTNGANHVGTFHLADLDQWTFHATAGSSIYLSIGEIVDNNTFSPWIRLFGPDGTQLDSRGGSVSAHLGVVAPLTGTYTVLVDTGEQNGNGTGTYRITLANIPGAFVVPAGDDGGPLTTGVNPIATFHLADLDRWTFHATAGNAISVSIAEVVDNNTFSPWIRIFGPNGTQLDSRAGSVSAHIGIVAPLTGTYTVLVDTGEQNGNGTGTYLLTSSHSDVPPLLSYVALGDSYSSGEGVFPYSDTINFLSGCHRSTRAYPRYIRIPGTLEPIASRADTEFDFIACSGAVTNNVISSGKDENGEPPQLAAVNHVDASRDLVTISIGGNDAQFVPIVKYCFLHNHCNDLKPFGPYSDIELGDLYPLWVAVVKANLLETYSEIRNATPNAATLVLGYPILVSGRECSAVQVPFYDDAKLSEAEQVFLRDANQQVNRAIAEAAAQIGLHFVPVADRFADHEVCDTGENWVNGLVPYNIKASFHPTSRGQLEYARIANDYLDSIQSGWTFGYLPNGLPRNPDPSFAPQIQANFGPANAPGSSLPEFGDMEVSLASAPPACQAALDLIVPGSLVAIKGMGFAPSESVKLSLVLSDQQTFILGNFAADASGTLGTTVMIPSSVSANAMGTVEALAAGPQGHGRLLLSLVKVAANGDACNAAPPTFTAISPSTGIRGRTVQVTLTGDGFAAPLGIDAGNGISVSDVIVAGTTSVTATFTIATNATLGDQNVTITTAAGRSIWVPFAVEPTPPPTLTSISPAQGSQASTVNVTLAGLDFLVPAVTVSGAGITVSNVTVTGPLSAKATFAIAPTAPAGSRNVIVTTAAGTSNPQVFTVTANHAPVSADDFFRVDGAGTLGVPAPGILGNDTDAENDVLTAVLLAPTTHGSLTLNPDGSFSYTHDESAILNDSFTYKAIGGSLESNAATAHITMDGLLVSQFQFTPSGFVAEFNRPIDPAVLNLFDTEGGGLGPGDAMLVGLTGGSVRGSMVVSGDNKTITFIRTGGVLPSDTYAATLRSAANGFRNSAVGALDGNGDGTGGDDFTSTFTIGTGSIAVVSVPDFLIGPGQPANLNGIGVPLTLTNGIGVSQIDLIVQYDPTLLLLTHFLPGAGLPAGSQMQADFSAPDRVHITVSIGSPINQGVVEFIRIGGQVPSAAPYRTSEILKITSLSLNGGAMPAIADDGLHVVAYIGDTTGNGAYSSLDAQRLLRVIAGLDSGFAAFPKIDPVVVADVTANGLLSSLDATRLLQETVGIDRPEIPALPSLIPVPIQPSLVTVNGRQVLLQRRNPDGTLSLPEAYVIRSVNWSPASRNTFTSPADPDNASVRRAEFGKWYQTDIPLLRTMNVNTVRLFIDPGVPSDGNIVVPGLTVLDELYRAGIMVIMTVDNGNNSVDRIQSVVNHYRNHPAILMWSLGSEFNINRFWKPSQFPTVDSAAQAIESAAQLVKSLDTAHPVAASYGSIVNKPNDIERYVTQVCPDIDVWSFNEYRGAGFSQLFEQWRFISNKPMFLGEFGIDAFNSTTLQEDPVTQANWDGRLWDEIARNLSADDPSRATLGGSIFEWNDEWWKTGSSVTQDSGGWSPIAFPDGTASEDWWGVVSIDRKVRQIYPFLTARFTAGYQAPSGPASITYRADSVFPSIGRFWENDTLMYEGQGASIDGGRGFNIAAIDLSTGKLRDPIQRFDTWAARTTGTSMNAMVSYLDSVPNGTLLLIAVGDEAGLNDFNSCTPLPYPWVAAAYQRLEGLGSTRIHSVCYQDQWAMIAIKGQGLLAESLGVTGDAGTQATLEIN